MCFIVKQRDEQTAAGKFVMDSGHGNIVNIPILANMVQNPNTIWQQPFKHQPTTSNHGDVIQITASPLHLLTGHLFLGFGSHQGYTLRWVLCKWHSRLAEGPRKRKNSRNIQNPENTLVGGFYLVYTHPYNGPKYESQLGSSSRSKIKTFLQTQKPEWFWNAEEYNETFWSSGTVRKKHWGGGVSRILNSQPKLGVSNSWPFWPMRFSQRFSRIHPMHRWPQHLPRRLSDTNRKSLVESRLGHRSNRSLTASCLKRTWDPRSPGRCSCVKELWSTKAVSNWYQYSSAARPLKRQNLKPSFILLSSAIAATVWEK